MSYFEPALTHHELVLSNNNKTVAYTVVAGVVDRMAQSAARLSAGKRYLEIQCNSLGVDTWHYLGLTVATLATNSAIATNNSNYAISADGYTWHNGWIENLSRRFSGNDVIRIAVNFDEGKIWFGKNGTWFTGNPSTNTTPLWSDALGKSLCLAINFSNYHNANFTGLFSAADQVYALPTGYEAWEINPALAGDSDLFVLNQGSLSFHLPEFTYLVSESVVSINSQATLPFWLSNAASFFSIASEGFIARWLESNSSISTTLSNVLLKYISEIKIPFHFFGEIGTSTFVGNFYDPRKEYILTKLKTGWLKNIENHINTYYGLYGKGKNLKITFSHEEGANAVDTIASMQTTFTGGISTKHELILYLKNYIPYESKDRDRESYVRTIAHEMVHGFVNDWRNQSLEPKWFIEGVAENIPGGLARLKYHLVTKSIMRLINQLNPTRVYNPGSSIFADPYIPPHYEYFDNSETSEYYAGAYLAIRYLHEYLKPLGFKRILNRIELGLTFSQAINETTEWADADEFLAFFTAGNWGGTENTSPGSVWYLSTVADDHPNGDVGGFAGFNVDGGDYFYNETIFNTFQTEEEQPVSGFIIEYPEIITSDIVYGRKAFIYSYDHALRLMCHGAGYAYYISETNRDESTDVKMQFVKGGYVFNSAHISLDDMTEFLLGNPITILSVVNDNSISYYSQWTEDEKLFKINPFVERPVGIFIYSTVTPKYTYITNPLLFYIDLTDIDANVFLTNTFFLRWVDEGKSITWSL